MQSPRNGNKPSYSFQGSGARLHHTPVFEKDNEDESSINSAEFFDAHEFEYYSNSPTNSPKKHVSKRNFLLPGISRRAGDSQSVASKEGTVNPFKGFTSMMGSLVGQGGGNPNNGSSGKLIMDDHENLDGSQRSSRSGETRSAGSSKTEKRGSMLGVFTSSISMATSAVTSSVSMAAHVGGSTIGAVGHLGNSIVNTATGGGANNKAAGNDSNDDKVKSFFDRRKPKHPPKNTKIASRELEIIKRCQEQMKNREVEEAERRKLEAEKDIENLRLRKKEAEERELVTREVQQYREMMKGKSVVVIVVVVLKSLDVYATNLINISSLSFDRYGSR